MDKRRTNKKTAFCSVSDGKDKSSLKTNIFIRNISMQGQDLMIEIDCLDGQGLTIDIDSDADRASLEKEGTTNQQLANWPQYDDYTHCHQNCGVYMNRGRRSDM